MTNLVLQTQNATPFNNASISVIAPSTVQTMSSKEIADLTGKEHKHVLADIRNMFEQLRIDSAEFSAQYKDSTGRSLPCFNLDKELSVCLVSGYNVQLRMAIIKRWTELEAQAQQSFALPTTFSQALLLAAQLEEQKEQLALQVAQQQQVIEIQAPKAEVFDAVLDKSRTYSIREFAQRTGVKEKTVKQWLADKLWMTGTDSKSYRPLARANVGNYMRMVKQGKTFTDKWGVPHHNETIEFTQDGFNEAVRKMVKLGMMKPLAEEA